MARPPISSRKLSETLTVSECHRDSNHPHGFWLYDETRGMNLSMGAKTVEDALVEALGYYQKRLQEVERQHKELTDKVDNFVSQFIEQED